MKLLSIGAEATVYEDEYIHKVRHAKGYRIKELDVALRRTRTRKEGKILQQLPIIGPKLVKVDERSCSITMQKIEGVKLRDVLNNSNCEILGKELGEKIAKLHDSGIIHGDLTTSNMILHDQGIVLIDYGLSFNSHREEDKAVDLHLLKQALISRHDAIWEKCFYAVLDSYGRDRPAAARLAVVEARGRNKH